MTTEAPETARFGWCLTADHRACRVQFTDHGKTRRCGCNCHVREETR